MKLTASTARTIPTPETEVIIRDDAVAGLMLRVLPSGLRLYAAQLRVKGGPRRTIRIGDARAMTLTQARAEALRLREMAAKGEDPSAPPPAPATRTLGEALDEYLTAFEAGLASKKQPRPASIVSEKKDVAILLRQLDRDTPLASLDDGTLLTLRDKITPIYRPTGRKRILGLLLRVVGREALYKRFDPAIHAAMKLMVTQLKIEKSPARERVLTPDEIRAIWTACADLGIYGQLVRFLIAQPLRHSAATGLLWSDVKLDDGTFTLRADATGNKARATFVMPLSQQARAILEAMPHREGRVFVTSHGNREKKRLDAASGVKDWQLHDLRRTFQTNVAEAAVTLDVDAIERMMGHKITGIRGGYDYSKRPDAQARVAGQWSALLASYLDPKSNITPITRKATA